MPKTITLNNFSIGELSPRLKGRVDLEEFVRGVKTCENWIPFTQGPITTRPGTLDVGAVKDESARTRLLPFKFGTSVSYALEVGDEYGRAYKNNAGTYQRVDSTFQFKGVYDASSEVGGLAQDMFLKADGTKLYITTNGAVFQYTLSTAWDITTASYDSKTVSISAEGTKVRGLYFKSDGTKMYTVEITGDDSVNQYTLSTPWDVSTATYDSVTFDISGEISEGTGLAFSSDGTKMYVTDTSDIIEEYNLGTAWDISTASDANSPFDTSAQTNEPHGLGFNSDGTNLYVTCITNNEVYKYILGTAWDVSTAVFSQTLDASGQVSSPRGVGVDQSDESVVFVLVAGNVYQYGLEITMPYATADLQDIQYIQSNDVLYLANGSYPPRKIQRISETEWASAPINFNPPPTQNLKEAPTESLTLSAITGTSVTVTAGGATFLGADINKVITAGRGKAIITGYTSSTVMTAEVLDGFDSLTYASGSWYISGTPYEDIDADAVGPVNGTINITCNVDTFRSGTDSLPTDVGKYIYLQGGIVKITSVTNAQAIVCKCIKLLDAHTATYDWTLEKPIWNASDGYPSTVVFHQDRLIWGGSSGFPQTISASYVGDYENHARGTADADSWLITLNAREVNEIEWLMSRQDLIVGTTEAEWAIQANGGILTPSDISAKLQTAYGSKSLRPAVVDGSILFFQRLGRKLRELTYDFNVSGYTAPEMTLIAEHITDGGIEEIAYQQSPFSIIWMVRSDGQLIGFTYDKKAGSIAWHRHVIGGAFSGGDAVVESVAVIPHPSDDYDELWMIVKRTINGATSRRIEVLTKVIDDPDTVDPASYWELDSGKATAIVASDTITGLSAWEGETLTVVNRSNGSYLGTFPVTSGAITLSTTYTATMLTGYFANKDLQLNDPIHPELMGIRIKTAELMLLLHNSLGGQAGRDFSNLSPIQYLDSNQASITLEDADLVDPPDLISAWTAKFSIKRSSDRGGALAIRQNRPFPMTILVIKAEVA